MAEEVSPKNKILTIVLNGLAFLAVGLSLTGWLNPPAGVVLMGAAVVYWLWEILAFRFTTRYIASPFHRGLIGIGIFAIIAAACWSPISKRLHSREQRTTSASSGTQDSKPAETKPQEKTTKEDDEAKKKAVKQGPKVEQHSQGDNSPNIHVEQQSSGPNSPNIAQFGNNNQAIINAAPPPRVVPGDKENDFKDALRTSPGGTIGVVKAGSSDDVAPLKDQIIRLAQEAGWMYLDAASMSTDGETPQAKGLECYCSNGWNTPMAKAFQAALTTANLKCTYFDTAYTWRGVTITEGRPTLVIGRNTQP